ncbi:hypothetical protein DP129_10965 [Clostridium tetani]|uniref:phage tail-collar fiber domain-containing protein n=1 Tax=Clostridium tetani TaxID=1513 RepID=UPI00100B6437|nr:phage tail protein [Clostridium tetani]RXI38732.1 hypothetical protein DP129_10965 [Clostridium tetani]
MASDVITDKAKEKMVKARAGDITFPKITHMVFGDGAIEEDGKPIAPFSSDNSLKNELIKKAIDGHTYPSINICRYSCTLTKEDLVDKNINEIGLVDAEGDLICIKTFGNKYKDSDMEMIFEIDDEF